MRRRDRRPHARWLSPVRRRRRSLGANAWLRRGARLGQRFFRPGLLEVRASSRSCSAAMRCSRRAAALRCSAASASEGGRLGDGRHCGAGRRRRAQHRGRRSKPSRRRRGRGGGLRCAADRAAPCGLRSRKPEVRDDVEHIATPVGPSASFHVRPCLEKRSYCSSVIGTHETPLHVLRITSSYQGEAGCAGIAARRTVAARSGGCSALYTWPRFVFWGWSVAVALVVASGSIWSVAHGAGDWRVFVSAGTRVGTHALIEPPEAWQVFLYLPGAAWAWPRSRSCRWRSASGSMRVHAGLRGGGRSGSPRVPMRCRAPWAPGCTCSGRRSCSPRRSSVRTRRWGCCSRSSPSPGSPKARRRSPRSRLGLLLYKPTYAVPLVAVLSSAARAVARADGGDGSGCSVVSEPARATGGDWGWPSAWAHLLARFAPGDLSVNAPFAVSPITGIRAGRGAFRSSWLTGVAVGVAARPSCGARAGRGRQRGVPLRRRPEPARAGVRCRAGAADDRADGGAPRRAGTHALAAGALRARTVVLHLAVAALRSAGAAGDRRDR